jgi:hypothetical protein
MYRPPPASCWLQHILTMIQRTTACATFLPRQNWQGEHGGGGRRQSSKELIEPELE